MLLGTLLALLHLRSAEAATARPPWLLGFAHGVIGAAGFAALAWALAAPPHGAARGIGAFGWDAIALLGAALLLGLAIPLLARARRRSTDLAMVLHGSVAIIGYVILMAYVSLG